MELIRRLATSERRGAEPSGCGEGAAGVEPDRNRAGSCSAHGLSFERAGPISPRRGLCRPPPACPAKAAQAHAEILARILGIQDASLGGKMDSWIPGWREAESELRRACLVTLNFFFSISLTNGAGQSLVSCRNQMQSLTQERIS